MGLLGDITSAIGIPLPFGDKPASSTAVFSSVADKPSAEINRKVQALKKENWNLSLPYTFKVCNANADGSVTNLTTNPFASTKYFQLNQFTFYTPPSSISISTPYAVNLISTNGGILEEFNGTVFRNIMISGTTGVFPMKANRGKKPGGIGGALGSLANAIAPGVTSAVSGLINSVNQVSQAVFGDADEGSSLKNDITDEMLYKTGYHQLWQLNNFLTAYTEFKKKSQYQNARLVFISAKDNIAYVVTPIYFELKRDAASPLLYNYTITLRAWDLAVASIEEKVDYVQIPEPENVSVIKAATNVISSAQGVILAANNVLSAVNSDLFSIMNLYNQGVIFLNSLTGIKHSVRNFQPVFKNPNNFEKLVSSSETNRAVMRSAITNPSETNVSAGARSIASGINNFTTASGSPSGSTAGAIVGAGGSNDPTTATPGGEDKPSAQTISNQSSVAAQIAIDTNSFQTITLDQLDIPDSVQAQIDEQIAEAQNLTTTDMVMLTENLRQVNDNYATSLNLMDATYAATYKIPFTASTTSVVPTVDDILTAVALEDGRVGFTSLLATGQIFKEREPDPFLLANRALPDDNQLPTPQGQFSVPFQRGSTLETMAQFHLGDANLAREIAILNNLRAPYIDEDGFDVPILSASERSFIISDRTNVAINQKISIRSPVLLPTSRTIINITALGTKFRVTVDGEANLEMYSPVTNPYMHTRLPGTIGSGDTVLIPSFVPPSDVFSVRPTALYASLSNSDKIFKIDIALDARGQDIAVGATGDADLVFGDKAAIQAIRQALEIEQKELEQHPNFGLPIRLGSRNADLSITDIEEAISSTITKDPRFVSADVEASLAGNVVRLNVVAQGAEASGEIPVSFDIGLA